MWWTVIHHSTLLQPLTPQSLRRTVASAARNQMPRFLRHPPTKKKNITTPVLNFIIPANIDSELLSHSPPGDKMGNGSMKSKRYKCTDGSFKKSSVDSLRARVVELEREGRRKDEELCAREQQVRSLQEQLAKQSRALAQLGQQLQDKCVQLNKLQDVMRNQGAAQVGLPARAPSVRTGCRGSPNLGVRIKETLNRRRGAKEGVSAEPTSRTYDSSSLPKFSFEKARVPKDAW